MTTAAPATTPQIGSRGVAVEQLALGLTDERPVPLRIQDTVEAIGIGADCMGGTVAFAAVVVAPHAAADLGDGALGEGGKGSRMEPFAIYLALFDNEAFEAAINHMAVARGFKPLERVQRLTPEQRAGLLASAVTDKVKRQIEREHGLPAGALDS